MKMQVKVTEYQQVEDSGPLGGTSYVYIVKVSNGIADNGEDLSYEV